MKILVTGAAGFLGGWVARLALERGHAVRGMARDPAEARSGNPDLNIEWARADLLKPETLDSAVTGMDAVIHCAAATPTGRVSLSRSTAINVEGTRGLLAASARAGVAHCVQISTVSARPDNPSVYARTKLEADRLVMAHPAPPLWTILRPDLIYGPGSRGLVARTLGMLRRLPFVPVVGPGDRRLRPLFVEDVAKAALNALETPEAAGRIFVLGGGTEVTLDEFFRALCRHAGLRRPLVHIPFSIAFFLARVGELLLQFPPLNADNIHGVMHASETDDREARASLRHLPLDLESGLARTFTRNLASK